MTGGLPAAQSHRAHLDTSKAQGPLGRLIEASERITCRCWGDPNAESRRLLADFEPTFHDTGAPVPQRREAFSLLCRGPAPTPSIEIENAAAQIWPTPFHSW